MPGQVGLECMVDVHTQAVQEANRHTTPFYNDIVAGLEHGSHFHAGGAGS